MRPETEDGRQYKPSCYNVFLEDENGVFVFNAVTFALVELDDALHKKLKSKALLDEDDFSSDSLKELKKSGILVDPRMDELEYLRFKHYSEKYDRTLATLIIYPTLKCNFSCPYCFEEYKGSTISDDVLRRIVRFIETSSNKLQYLNIRWSGGEPLLVWDKIVELSESFIHSCTKNNVHYSASIASNGYLLDEKISRELPRLKISVAQITLDGPPSIHNKRRFMPNNKEGTFEKILHNIKIATNYANIVIRVNIDRGNVNGFSELLSILDAEHLNKDTIRLFCKPVISCYRDLTTYEHKEFYEIESELLRIAVDKGFPFSFHPNIGAHVRCPYYQINSFMICPMGDLYKCPEHIGNKAMAIGHIDENGLVKITDLPKYLKSSSYDPFAIEECKGCNVLPLCFGKCPIIWEQRDRRSQEGCIPEKCTLENKLRYAIRSKNQLFQFVKTEQRE